MEDYGMGGRCDVEGIGVNEMAEEEDAAAEAATRVAGRGQEGRDAGCGAVGAHGFRPPYCDRRRRRGVSGKEVIFGCIYVEYNGKWG